MSSGPALGVREKPGDQPSTWLPDRHRLGSGAPRREGNPRKGRDWGWSWCGRVCSLPFKQRLSPDGLNLATGSSARKGGWSQVTLGQQRGPWVPSPQHLLMGHVHSTPPLSKPWFISSVLNTAPLPSSAGKTGAAGAPACWRGMDPSLYLAWGWRPVPATCPRPPNFFPLLDASHYPRHPRAQAGKRSPWLGLAGTSQDGEGLPPSRPPLWWGLETVKGALSPAWAAQHAGLPGATLWEAFGLSSSPCGPAPPGGEQLVRTGPGLSAPIISSPGCPSLQDSVTFSAETASYPPATSRASFLSRPPLPSASPGPRPREARSQALGRGKWGLGRARQ